MKRVYTLLSLTFTCLLTLPFGKHWGAVSAQTITTGTVSTATCTGSSISVPFTSAGVTFNSGNIFTAQLSTASGSFTGAMTIGTLSGTAASGTINATIPTNSAAGSAYRIRVKSSNPAVTGADNGSNITLIISPTQLSEAFPASQVKLCTGATGTLTANTGTGLTYQWLNNYVPISGQTASTLSISAAGSYSVSVTNTSGCAKLSNQVRVTIPGTANAKFTPNGNISLCTGATKTLTAPVGADSYTWNRNGSPIGDNSYSLNVHQSGTYTLTVTNGNTCSASSTASAVVSYSGSSSALTANAGVDQFLCSDAAVMAGNTPGAGITGTWVQHSGTGTITDLHDPATTVTGLSPGNHLFSWTFTDGTCTGKSDTVSLNYLPGSANPVVITAGSPLFFCTGSVTLTAHTCGSGWTYQWKRGSLDIAGATSSTYTVSTFGNAQSYDVIATNGGTPYTSNSLVVNNQLPLYYIGKASLCVGQSFTAYINSISGATYQWYRNGIAISGATDTLIVLSSAANYQCKASLTGGCVFSTKTFPVTVSLLCSYKTDETEGESTTTQTIEEASSDVLHMKIYPNPTDGNQVSVDMEGITGSAELQIFDIIGQRVMERQMIQPGVTGLAVNSLSNGIYVVEISTGKMKKTERLVISR